MPMSTAIREALANLEASHRIRVLLAVESGSRAWGFASPNSDYDVRFVFAHPVEWYVAVGEPRDVVEASLPGDLDVSGWDLRKALRLFAKGNVALFEWLGSTLVYVEEPAFVAELRALVPRFFEPIAAGHHYLSLAKKSWSECGTAEVRLKRVFYAMRALLAFRWIERTGTQPPTPFAELVLAPWVAPEERQRIADMEIVKRGAAEGDRHTLAGDTRRWIDNELTRASAAVASLPKGCTGRIAELDALLWRWVTR